MDDYTDPPRFPAGTPEYEAYATELRAELGKWVRKEPPYDVEHSRSEFEGRHVACSEQDKPRGDDDRIDSLRYLTVARDACSERQRLL